MIIERFLTVAHLHGTLPGLPTPRVILNLIEEQHLLRYHMPEGIQLAGLFLLMFLSGTPADIRLDARERDEENEQMTPTLYTIGTLRSELIYTLTA